MLDLAMGAAITGGGLMLLVSGTAWGWALVAVGALQLFFAGGRAVKWRRIRRQAGL